MRRSEQNIFNDRISFGTSLEDTEYIDCAYNAFTATEY